MNTQTPAESLFYQALELSSEECIAFLDKACSADPALRAEVDELLQAYRKSNGFLTRDGAPAGINLPLGCASWRQQNPQQAGECVGPYKLLEQIGEGGFGTVWVAEQEHPIRRRVALKIIKLGMDTKEVVARFEQERQALALMDHPNIARVLDAGATPTGRPFFLMELVKGIKITDYCDEARLATRDRLRLFVQVCSAVQHAHQKGIIHRDLKPSNILVTLHDGIPVPKVIDFGVAKATQQQRLTELTIYTQFEQMVGTPLYMAPEQAEMSGLDIDTRSDIYSLGVLLYELLTGRTPFDPEALMRRGLDEIRRVIREEEPQKPSMFVSTMALELRTNVAKHRNLEGAKLISSIKGDLDWIVMKALEKDRNRRYETASSFAQDIERHLSSEPVHARPPSAAYRFRRFVRRNQTAVGAGSAFVLLLLVAAAGVVWQAIRAQRGEAAATAALAELRASAPVFADQARSLVDKDCFNEALEKLDTAIKLRPDVVDYVLSKANLLQAQLRFAEAADVYRIALRLTPAGERASANAALCDTLAVEMAAKGKPSRGSLARLASAMEKEGRPTAERIRIERLLGEEKKLLVDYWLKRLKDLSLPPEYPLEKQLILGKSGLLQLALIQTPITDLSPLAGMPLETLILSGSKNIKDLSPLRGMPLRELWLGEMVRGGEYYAPCEISDLSALRGLPLKSLNLAKMLVSDLAPLQGVPLETLDLSGTVVRDVTALRGMPLRQLYCNETPVLDFSPIIGAPLEVLSLQNTKVSDLSFLRELPVKVLLLDGANDARGLSVLTEMGHLELLTLSRSLMQWPDEEMAAVERLRRSERLRGIQFGPPDWAESGISTKEPAEFWREFDELARMRKVTVTVASLARAGRFQEAAEVTRAQLAPEGDSTNCMLLCIELAAAGDLKGYRAACDEMLRRFAHPNRADEAERTLRCVLLLPQEGLDKTVLERLTEYVRNEKATAWDELAAGLADYRASRLDSAADWLVRCCARAVVSNRCKSAASAVLAMTEYRRGNVEAAKTALAASRSMISAQWPNGDELNWHAWLMADILCREAEALIR